MQTLLAHDQLSQERAAGRAFAGYGEGAVAFAPTYKFDRGEGDAYDTSEKRRVPSWTDRILFRPAADPAALELLHYGSVPELRSSDHRAVTATFRVALRASHVRTMTGSTVTGRGDALAASPARGPTAGRLGTAASAAESSATAAATTVPVAGTGTSPPADDGVPAAATKPPLRGGASAKVLPEGSPAYVAAQQRGGGGPADEAGRRAACPQCAVM